MAGGADVREIGEGGGGTAVSFVRGVDHDAELRSFTGLDIPYTENTIPKSLEDGVMSFLCIGNTEKDMSKWRRPRIQ